MKNQVRFFGKNTPSNATIETVITLNQCYTHEEAIDMAFNVLRSWGIPECNIDRDFATTSYFDAWAE